MKPAERAAQARRELGRKFSAADIGPIEARPRGGWIRAIREALSMSQAVLAQRLKITRGSVNKLEHAELHGGITVRKLAEVAAAMDCDLVYALIPRSSLEQTVLDQARASAAKTSRYAARTMELSGQAVSDDYLQEAIERDAHELVRKGKVWDAAWPASTSRCDTPGQSKTPPPERGDMLTGVDSLGLLPGEIRQ